MHGGRHERVTELLDQLIEFSRMHFFSEEQLMLQTSFPGLHDHRDEHQRMLAEMLHAAHRVHNDEQLQTREMLLALHDGFLAHIEGLDRAYGPWLHDHGIS
jgi:hemerythrin-like metal-binding protein